MQKTKKYFASLLMAGAMTLGGIGVATIVSNHTSASADTASVYAEEDPAIGMGEENKATVTIASDAPVTLTLNNVTAGQYFLVFKVEGAKPDDYLDITAQIGESYAFPTYNSHLEAFVAQVDVAADSQIILTTYAETPITADVYLTELFIGDSTANAIYGLPVSSTAAKSIPVIETTSGTYYARFNTYDKLEENAKFYIQIDDGTPAELVYNENMGGYIAEVTMTSSVKTITISTTNTATISFDLELIAKIEVTEKLPVDTTKDFTLYEVQRFVYTATETGYFTITTKPTPANAEFAITLKTNPNYLTGDSIMGNNYPIRMVEGTDYYFEITYTGIRVSEDDEDFDPDNPPVPPTTASATFAIDSWTASPIELNEIVYVPVTLATDTTHTVPVTINGIVGNTYDVGLMNVPFYDKNVYMHYGTEVKTLNAENGFTGSITMKEGQTTVYFTTDYTEEFTTGVSLNYTPVEYDDEIKLDTLKSITLRPGETRLYIVYDLPEGEYKITLTGTNGNVVVGDAYDNTLIAQGSNEGFFNITLVEDMPSLSEYLYITNNGTSELTFNVLVNVTPVKTLVVGEAQEITLGANETQNYEIALTAGAYTITLAYPDGSRIEVSLDGAVRINAGSLSVTLPVTVSGTHVLSFTNLAAAEVTFTVTVTARA